MLKRMAPVDSAHQIGLATLLIDVLTVDGGVSGWRLKNSKIGHVFEYGATPSGDMLKRMAPVDSAHEIGLATLLIDVLTVDEGVSGWRLKNRQIGHVVHYSSTTGPRASKRRTALKSTRQIGVSTISKDVLTVDEGVSGWRLKNRQIGRVFEYGATPSGDMLKRVEPVDSAHQIGLATLLIDVLTVDEGVSRWRFKNRQIGHVVHCTSTTRPRASKRRTALKSARQIGVSTISKDVLTVDEGVCGWIFKNREIGHVFGYSSTARRRASKRRTALKSAHQIGVSTISKDVLTVDEGVSRWRFKNRQIGHVVHYSSTTRPRASKRRTELKSARQIGVSTISKDVLTVDEGVSGWRLKNRQIGHGFAYSSTSRALTSKRRTALKL